MRTITVVLRCPEGRHECDCYDFECLCERSEDGTCEYSVYGIYLDSNFRLGRGLAGYFLDQDAALDKLYELKARLVQEEQKQKMLAAVKENQKMEAAARLTDLIRAFDEGVVV